jgi:hypothetical protein
LGFGPRRWFVYKRPMRTTWIALTLLAVGCGDDGGGSGTTDASNGPDAKEFRDAAPTSTVTVTVSGQATKRTASGATPVEGAEIVAYRNADENTPIAMTTTNAGGFYTLAIPTNGEAIDGFLKATKSQLLVTYLYPPYPLTSDFDMATVIMVDQQTYDTLYLVAVGSSPAQDNTKGTVGLIVTDGNAPVADAVVTSTPAPNPEWRYNGMSGSFVLPSKTATKTYTDGVAYGFNIDPGMVTVSATHPTLTLSSHALKVHGGRQDEAVLTTTVIVP